MSGDPGGVRSGRRCALECALGLCAVWLLVQNVVIVIALLAGGTSALLHTLAPLLVVALVLMTPLWCVPAIALLAGWLAKRRAGCPGTREVTQ